MDGEDGLSLLSIGQGDKKDLVKTSLWMSASLPTSSAPSAPKRFYGTIKLNPQRLATAAGQVGEEVLQHLTGLVDSRVEVTLEITVKVAEGIPDRVVRTVSENANTLKFEHFDFEAE